jgi:hypothetical protein
MAGEAPKKPTKAAKKPTVKRPAGKPALLAGGDPQIAKGKILPRSLDGKFRLRTTSR